MQGKWCCSAARGVEPSTELPSGPRCLAWSWGFSKWWQRVRALHKWFHSPQHRESATAPSGTGCCDACQEPATLPENLSSCQGKEPNLQGECRDVWGAEEISRNSEDFISKAAWNYGKNCGFHNLARTHTHIYVHFLYIYIQTLKRVKCRLDETENPQKELYGLPDVLSVAMASLIPFPVKITSSYLATLCLQRCYFERDQEQKRSRAGSSFSESWSSWHIVLPFPLCQQQQGLQDQLSRLSCLRSRFQINCFDISVWHQQLILPTLLRLW